MERGLFDAEVDYTEYRIVTFGKLRYDAVLDNTIRCDTILYVSRWDGTVHYGTKEYGTIRNCTRNE